MSQYLYDNCYAVKCIARASDVIDLLGGVRALGRRVSSEKDLVASLQKGLPYRSLEAVKHRLQLSAREISEATGIHPRTLVRRKSQRQLRSDESDLNTAKFKVIHELENWLPAALFRYEWESCEQRKGKAYKPITHLERFIP